MPQGRQQERGGPGTVKSIFSDGKVWEVPGPIPALVTRSPPTSTPDETTDSSLWSQLQQLSKIHVNPWLIHVNVRQEPLQYCGVIGLQLVGINEKKT